MRVILLATLWVPFVPATVQADEKPRKPNIIVILADDLGYGDLGVHGLKGNVTPHIDSLAASGVRCTSGYVTGTVCSPTRAALLTGRYQQRFGHEFNPALLRHGGSGQGLPVEERTIADLLRAGGYATGLFGKWHLGEDEQFWPTKRGFDEFYGFLPGAHSFFESHDKNYGPIVRGKSKGKSGATPLEPVELPEGDEGYLTRVLAKEACNFIERQRQQPFFVYLSFNAVHTPMHAPKKTIDQHQGEADEMRRTYLAMLQEMDEAVGQVLATLRKHGLEEDTLIFFLSDNGGPTTKFSVNGSRNRPLRGSKGDTWEGGIRVPFIVQWKGRLPAGKTYDMPVISLDILPTALAAADAGKQAKGKLDGVNLLPILQGMEKMPERALFWRFGSQMAVRQGDWVLVRPSTGEKEYEAIAVKPMLFNVTEDIGQDRDLAARRPEMVRRLQESWDRWSAELPQPRWPATLRGKVFTMP